ncbi:MAG: NAD(P)H-hydrate dehydratase [Lachnospiraceae bacterium]|nr:NAD(P)H-hydrate dehydratase [Lachnospiraceae bacterium]
MKYILSAKEASEADKYTSETFHVSPSVLMERAALFTAETIMERFPDREAKIVSCCGKGNNGGDGIAAARILFENDYRQIKLFMPLGAEGLSGSEKEELSIAKAYGIDISANIDCLAQADIIIDALFGTGLSRAPEGAAADAVSAINASKAFTVSIDIPSGVDATSGEIPGKAVRADLTTTYSFLKRGHVLYPGREYAGEVLCKNIGITENSFTGHMPECFCLEDRDIRRLLPVRKKDSHKGTYGRVLVAAGSPGMAGACIFAAKAAFLSGAGLVDILTAEENRVIVQESLPEAILHTYSGRCSDSLIKDCCDKADCIVIGPGLSTEKNAVSLFQSVFETASVPMVIDADGLNILSGNISLLQRPHTSLVLTPHPGELSRLLSEPYELIRPRIFSACGDFSRANQVTLVAKGASTLIFEPFRETCINTTGDDSLSTAGSGDILAGLTGGLIATGMKAPDAARTAVYLHGKSGERAGQKTGSRSCMAGDILSALPETL